MDKRAPIHTQQDSAVALSAPLEPVVRRNDLIRERRLAQPLEELRRKQKKARRRGIWTQEDIDYAEMEAEEMVKFFNPLPSA